MNGDDFAKELCTVRINSELLSASPLMSDGNAEVNSLKSVNAAPTSIVSGET